MLASYEWFFRIVAIACFVFSGIAIIMLPRMSSPVSDDPTPKWKRLDIPGRSSASHDTREADTDRGRLDGRLPRVLHPCSDAGPYRRLGIRRFHRRHRHRGRLRHRLLYVGMGDSGPDRLAADQPIQDSQFYTKFIDDPRAAQLLHGKYGVIRAERSADSPQTSQLYYAVFFSVAFQWAPRTPSLLPCLLSS
jgi:hypothetical protein